MISNFPSKYLVLMLLVVCGPASLAADTIVFRNGTEVTGTVYAQSRTIIRVRTADGERTFRKANLRRIIFGGPDETTVLEERNKKEEEARKKQEEADRDQQEAEDREAEAREAAEDERRRSERAERARREAAEPEDPHSGALGRSLLYPGWGQFRQGRTGAGVVYATAFTVALLGTAGAGANYAADRNAYLGAVENLDFQVYTLGFLLPLLDEGFFDLRDDLFFLQYFALNERNAAFRRSERSAVIFNVAGGILGAIYLANAFDVTVYSDQGVALDVFSEGEYTGLAVRFIW